MYQKNGNEIVNERGAVIARLDVDGTLRMAAGKKSQEAKVREFLNEAEENGMKVAEEIVKESCLERSAAAKEPSWDDVEAEARTLGCGSVLPKGKTYEGEVVLEHVEPGSMEEKPQTEAEWQIGTIPDDELPPFSAEHGTSTPGFREYVEKHNLNNEQVRALIKRICAKKGW